MPSSTSSTMHPKTTTENQINSRRLLFPRASGLPRGKMRKAGVTDHATVKTTTWNVSL